MFYIRNTKCEIIDVWTEKEWEFNEKNEIIKRSEINFIIKFDSEIEKWFFNSKIEFNGRTNAIGFLNDCLVIKLIEDDKSKDVFLLDIENENKTITIEFKKI